MKCPECNEDEFFIWDEEFDSFVCHQCNKHFGVVDLEEVIR